MRRVLGLALLVLLVLLVSAVPASAQACTDSAATLNFGTYTGTLQTSVSTVTITCHGNNAYKVGLDAGLGIGATFTTRKMTGPAGAMLNYQIFQDSARTLNWGNTSGVDTLSGTGNSGAQAYFTYAQVAAGRSSPLAATPIRSPRPSPPPATPPPPRSPSPRPFRPRAWSPPLPWHLEPTLAR